MKHKHNWQLSSIYMPDNWDRFAWRQDSEAIFICECGCLKRVKLKEVKE